MNGDDGDHVNGTAAPQSSHARALRASGKISNLTKGESSLEVLEGGKAEVKYYLVRNAAKIQFSLIRSGNRRQIGLVPERTGLLTIGPGRLELPERSVVAASTDGISKTRARLSDKDSIPDRSVH